jgi:hypothetical protein
MPSASLHGAWRASQKVMASSGPAKRASATHPNPAWHPKPSSLWPPVPPTLHQTLPRDAPKTPRSTSDRRSEVLRRVSHGATAVCAGSREPCSPYHPENSPIRTNMHQGGYRHERRLGASSTGFHSQSYPGRDGGFQRKQRRIVGSDVNASSPVCCDAGCGSSALFVNPLISLRGWRRGCISNPLTITGFSSPGSLSCICQTNYGSRGEPWESLRTIPVDNFQPPGAASSHVNPRQHPVLRSAGGLKLIVPDLKTQQTGPPIVLCNR